MGKGYSKNGGEAKAAWRSGGFGPVGDKLEEIARTGAQRLLAEMLDLEVNEFLLRVRYGRGGRFGATATASRRSGRSVPGWGS